MGFTRLRGAVARHLAWLIVTAPLSRALEPLDDPACCSLRRGRADRPARRDQGRAGRSGEARPADAGRLHRHRGPALLPPLGHRPARHRPRDGGQFRRPAASARAAARSPSSSPRPASCRRPHLKRKAQEVIIAFWLEGVADQGRDPLALPVERLFRRRRLRLRAASRHYFDREPERLTLAQSAMLAGWSRRRRGSRRRAISRRRAEAQRLVLQAMADTGVISQPRARAPPRAAGGASSKVPTGTYFADWVAPSAAQRRSKPTYGEVKVQTTLDADLQRLAGPRRAARRIGDAQAALVAMRPDGRVVAMVGGRLRRARSTARPRRGASRARRSSCSSISRRCVPAGRPTA